MSFILIIAPETIFTFTPFDLGNGLFPSLIESSDLVLRLSPMDLTSTMMVFRVLVVVVVGIAMVIEMVVIVMPVILVVVMVVFVVVRVVVFMAVVVFGCVWAAAARGRRRSPQANGRESGCGFWGSCVRTKGLSSKCVTSRFRDFRQLPGCIDWYIMYIPGVWVEIQR